jgi:hypothetical protein
MSNASESEFYSRQARQSFGAGSRTSIDGDGAFSLRDTLAHTEVRELSFAEFRAAMEQSRSRLG